MGRQVTAGIRIPTRSLYEKEQEEVEQEERTRHSMLDQLKVGGL